MKKIVFLSLVAPFSIGWSFGILKTDFGKYYQIGNYKIEVPFNEAPHISPPKEDDLSKWTSYQYCFPSPAGHANFMYAVDVLESKSGKLGDTARVNNFAVAAEKMY